MGSLSTGDRRLTRKQGSELLNRMWNTDYSSKNICQGIVLDKITNKVVLDLGTIIIIYMWGN